MADAGSDREAFAGAALELARRPELWAALGQNARRFYATQLDWPVLARRVMQTLEEAASNVVVQVS
ncbi:hypothetical protein [Rhodothermus marinus]|uniref:hypothetical protein n=1 Tax=Rhodothermus marinus TaxID=29549 RepID=UPI000B1C57EA|nr:hypothetical protein [Rhodothermus marinus]